MTAEYPQGDEPLIPMPALSLPALRQAVATVAPSRLPEFFQEIQDAFTQAGDEDSDGALPCTVRDPPNLRSCGLELDQGECRSELGILPGEGLDLDRHWPQPPSRQICRRSGSRIGPCRVNPGPDGRSWRRRAGEGAGLGHGPDPFAAGCPRAHGPWNTVVLRPGARRKEARSARHSAYRVRGAGRTSGTPARRRWPACFQPRDAGRGRPAAGRARR